jgi:hypothetical protein
MRISYDIPYAAVESVVASLWYTHGKPPAKKDVVVALRDLIHKGGECWLTEPTIDDMSPDVDWYSRHESRIAELSSLLHDNIY